jgi:hypothetical protein
MFERRVECPQCRRETRLSEAELAAKRGFCALCDARFDLLGDMVLGGGPMREQLVPRVALALAPLPSDRVSVESLAPDAAIVLRPRRTSRDLLLFLFWAVGMVSWALSILADGAMPGLSFALCNLVTGVSLLHQVIWRRTYRERLTVHPGELRIERWDRLWRRGTERVALGGVVELKVCPAPETALLVASTLTPPISVGQRLGLDATDAEWLRNALTARLAAVRP